MKKQYLKPIYNMHINRKEHWFNSQHDFSSKINLCEFVEAAYKTVQEKITDELIEHLYKEFKENPEFKDITDVYIISLPNFKRYLLETLPKWIKEQNSNDN